jgi:phosphate-selective porin OprO/OprP
MNSPLQGALASVVLLTLSFVPLPAQPVERAEVESLRARIRDLELQLTALMSRLDAPVPEARVAELRGATAPEPTKRIQPPASSDAAWLRTLIHVDARAFLEGTGRDTLVLRRARLLAEGEMAPRMRYNLVSDFGGNAIALLDASLTFDFAPGLQLRAGKFKSPLGMEILHPTRAVTFTERSLVSGLMPNRDVGVQLSSTPTDGGLQATVGIFNGGVDGTNAGNQDFDRHRDVVGRILVEPFRTSSVSAWRGLTIGVGGSHGQRRTSEGRTQAYRTAGQESYFSYLSAVEADGAAWRLSPQFDYRVGPLGLFGEYAISASRLRPDSNRNALSLRHRAWQLTGGYVFTGEDSSATGVVPRVPFDPGVGAWGAFEVVARWSEANLDEAAFPLLAAPDSSVTDVRSIAVGLNWYLSGAVRAMFNYHHSQFYATHGALRAGGAVRRPEEGVFVSRLQLAF